MIFCGIVAFLCGCGLFGIGYGIGRGERVDAERMLRESREQAARLEREILDARALANLWKGMADDWEHLYRSYKGPKVNARTPRGLLS